MTHASEAKPSQTPAVALGDLFYRYRDQLYSSVVDADRDIFRSRLELDIDTFEVFKITPKGFWIARSWDVRKAAGSMPTLRENSRKHFIRHSAKRKFAHAHRSDALAAFLERKTRQTSLLTAQLRRAEEAHRLGLEAQKRLTSEPAELSTELPELILA